LENYLKDVKYFVQELEPKPKNQRFLRMMDVIIEQVLFIVRGKFYVLFFPIIRFDIFLLFEHLFPCQPKFFGVLGFDVLVQRVLNLCLSQIRECSGDHDEQNDTH